MKRIKYEFFKTTKVKDKTVKYVFGPYKIGNF